MAIAQQVMILNKDGLLLLEHRFRGGAGAIKNSDPDLVSGMLSAILSIAKETGGGIVQTIHQDNYKVIVSEGEFVYLYLFIDEESRELENIARMIVNRFERKFHDQLTEIISDLSIYQSFKDDLEEFYNRIFQVDAEVLSNLIPELTNIKNVIVFEKPMNHQVYTGPRDSFVNEFEHDYQELAVKIIESQAAFSDKTLEFPKRAILEYKTRTIVLEDLGTHVLMVIGDDKDDILSKIRKIGRKVGINTAGK
jgi:hypothetical protein